MKKLFFAFTVTAVLQLSSCGISAPEGTALFDDFRYEGMDNFYEENPLHGEDMAYNPLLPGWYSDPSVCSNGKGDYFLVTSTFSYYPGVPLFHSRDLLNWKQVGNVLDRPSQLVNLDRQHVSGGIFAPAIEYNPHNGTYYMLTTNVGAGNFLVKTTDPFGEWSDPIMLPQVQGIDPSIFFDDDGRAYIVNNDDAPGGKPEYDGHRTIRIVEYDVQSDRTVGERRIIVDKGARPEDEPVWIEGPHLYKIDGWYYLMCAEGGTEEGHSEVIFRSRSVMGGYEPWEGNPILTQRHLDPGRSNPVTCAGHADLVQAPDGGWWAVFLACRPYIGGYENLGRETFMLPVKWSEDGFPVITEGNGQVPLVVRHPGAVRSQDVTFGNFSIEDGFDADTLSYGWMTLRGPADGLYSLSENRGFLQLSCSDAKVEQMAVPAAVLRRVQHHRFSASTRMYFSPEGDSDAAGMLLFKDERHFYFLNVRNLDGVPSVCLQTSEEGSLVLASAPLPKGCSFVELGVESSGTGFDFYYAPNGKNSVLLQENVPARFLSTAAAGGFTGTTIGLYAVR